MLQAAFKEAMSQHLNASASADSPYRPASEMLRETLLHLNGLHEVLDPVAQDFRALAQKSVQVAQQLERQLELANAAQKGLADMFIIEKELTQ